MKKFALQTLAIVLFVSTALTSCSNDDGGETIILKKSLVTSVDGPTTGAINQDITLTAKFTTENGCGQFNRFVETVNGNTKTIEVEAKYIGENCGSTPTEVTAAYKFRVIQAGTYTFKFKKNDTQFITKVVTIE